jgi:HK97 family phage portal protein
MPRTELIRVVPAKPPSRVARMVDAIRSFTLGPFSPKDPELARLFGGRSTTSGVSVNENTALNYSAVWAAVALISDDVASLPLMLYRKLPNGGRDKYESHPLYELLHDTPNPEMTSFTWRRTMQAHLSLWQNAYSEIERDRAGRPVAVWPLVPERVSKLYQDGQPTYRVMNPSGNAVMIPDADMIHLVGHSHDGSVGSSLVMHARESLGLGLAAERFGGSFFGNGSTFGGVISYKGSKPPELSDKGYRDQLEARHQGVERAHKLLALYNDASFTAVGVPPNQAQFLETRVFQIREVARWFKIPPHKLADLADATFSNVEQQNIDYYTSCLRPLLQLWEQELSRKLISRLERRIQSIEHVTQGLLQADAAGRSALYSAEFNVGAITPNEVRGFEGLDPIAGGDRSFIQGAMIPLDRIDEIIDAQIKAKTTPPAPTPPKTEPDPATVAENKALREAVELARHATQLAEDGKDMAVADAARLAAALEAERVARQSDNQAMFAEAERLRQARDFFALDAHAARLQVEDVTTQRNAATDKLTHALAERDEAVEKFDQLADDLRSAVADHATERTGRQQAESDRDAALALMAQAEQEREAARLHAESAQAERDAVVAASKAESLANGQALELLQGLRHTAETERDAAMALAAQAEQERDTAQASLSEMTEVARRLQDDIGSEREQG